MRRKVLFPVLIAFALVLAFMPAAMAAPTPVPVQLAFVVDGSASIPDADFEMMLTGIADAIVDPACVPQDGSLWLTVVQFSSDATIEVELTQIKTADDAAKVAAEIMLIQQKHTRTNYEAAFSKAIEAVNFALTNRQVINISTDGAPNEGNTNPTFLRDDAVSHGFDEIDAEFIDTGAGTANSAADSLDAPARPEAPVDVLEALVYPQPALVIPPAPWPPPTSKGGGWVRVVTNASEYSSTVCAKIRYIIPPAPIPEPASMMLLAGAAAAAVGYLRRRRSA